MDGEIRYPTGFFMKDIVAWGSFGLVFLDSSSGTVVKSAHDERTQPFIHAEQRVYERLHKRGGHSGILTYYGAYDVSSIRLQYAPKHDLRSFYRQANTTSPDQRRRWAIQIAESLAFIHQEGVIHGDLTCANVFLDEELNAKVADFSGSSLDKSPLLVSVTASYAHPGHTGSILGDIFAFGSLLYELETTHMPYSTLTDKEIEERYSRYDFPKTDSLGSIGNVIRGCWEGKYDNGKMIVKDLQGPSSAIQIPQPPTQRVSILLVSILVLVTVCDFG